MADDERNDDLIEWLAGLAGTLGLSETQVRWKLIRWRSFVVNWFASWRTTVEQSAYEHKVCAACGRVNDKERDTCTGCGADLDSTTLSFFRRLGLALPGSDDLTSLVGLAIVVVYLRMVQVVPGEGLMSWSVETLRRFGGNVPAAVLRGEYWRLVTAMFLHIGVLHLGFNLMALYSIGPLVQETFGWCRTLFLYMATGILANLARVAVGGYTISAGASGALMGLIGTAAGWGQREGTTIGREVRDVMLKWGLYTMCFGFVVGADDTAHLAGFVTGFVFGYLMHPDWLHRGRGATTSRFDRLLGLVGAVLALAAVLICLGPPDAWEALLRR